MKTFRIKFSNHENALNGREIRDNKSLRSVLHKIALKNGIVLYQNPCVLSFSKFQTRTDLSPEPLTQRLSLG